MIDFEGMSPTEIKSVARYDQIAPLVLGGLISAGGSILGGLLGGSGSKSTSTSSIPPWLADYWSGAIEAGKDIYQTGGPIFTGGEWQDVGGVPTQVGGTPTYLGDPTLYSPANPLMQESWDLLANATRQPGSLETAGRNYLENTLSGDFLNPATNPAIQNYADYAYQHLLAPELARAAKTGAYGGTDYLLGAQDVATGVGAQILPQLLQLQAGAAGQALPYESYALGRYNLLGDIGREQRGLDIERRREPWDRLGLLTGIIQGVPGGQGTVTQSTEGNPWAGALGGGLTTLGLLGQGGFFNNLSGGNQSAYTYGTPPGYNPYSPLLQ